MKLFSLNSLSIRDRFLIAPLIGVLLTLIVYFAANSIIKSKVELLTQINKSNLPLVSEYSKASISMLNLHAHLTHLLLVGLENPDEETMYLGGRKIIDELYVIETHLYQNLEQSKKILVDQVDVISQNKLAFIHYKEVVISTIELVSVDPSQAKSELLRANSLLSESYKLLISLSNHYIHSATKQAKQIEQSIDSSKVVTLLTAGLLMVMIFTSLYLARRMSTSIEVVNKVMVELASGNLSQSIPANKDKYLANTYAAVAIFKETLIKSEQQQQALTQIVSELEGSKERYFNLIDIAASAIIVVDEKLNICLFNKAAQQLFAYPFSEVENKGLFSYIENSQTFSRQVLQEYLCLQHSRILIFDQCALHAYKKSGEVFYIHISIAKQAIDGNKFITLSLLDVSERLLKEQRLRDSQNQLERLVTDRTKELQTSLDALRQTQRQLIESEKMASLGGLVAGVAHEINTPVGIGITASSQLQDLTEVFSEKFMSGKLSKTDLEKFISHVQSSTKINLSNLVRAADLINSFKEISVDQSTEEVREFDIGLYTEDILLSLNTRFKNTSHTISLRCPKELVITNVPGTYSQILTNFLINSLIHGFETMESGKIGINISCIDKNILLKYTDNGCGMDAEQLNKLYEPFFTSKRSQGSTGLGMNIVYNLVTQKLGGHIQCCSEIGQGVEFNVSFPCHLAMDIEQISQTFEASEASDSSVLD